MPTALSGGRRSGETHNAASASGIAVTRPCSEVAFPSQHTPLGKSAYFSGLWESDGHFCKLTI